MVQGGDQHRLGYNAGQINDKVAQSIYIRVLGGCYECWR